MRKKPLGALLSIALVAAACGSPTEELTGDGPILQITSEGGFVPVEVALNTGPRYTVLADGRVIYPGFETMEFPGALIPPYQVARLGGSQLHALLAMVEDIGLPDIEDEIDDSAIDFVADATTEVITYWDDNGEHRYGVYALGIEETPTERNTAFLELLATLDRFTAEAPAETYPPERVRLLAGDGFADPGFEDVREWPLTDSGPSDWTALPNGWRCEVFGGSTLTLFDDATEATRWELPDGSSDPVQILVRPLHPGEPDCPL